MLDGLRRRRIAAIAPGCKPGTDRYRRFESCRRHVKPPRRLSPEEYADNQRAYFQRIRESISKIGFSATHVFSPDGRSSSGFIYTIGLTEKNLPELRISQFHHLLAGEVIGQMAPQIIAEHGNRFATAEGAAACLAAGGGYDVDIQEDGQPPVRFGFRLPSVFDGDRPLGAATAYYGRRVMHVEVTAEGWPCPRCAPLDDQQPCTCTFSCWWNACGKLSEYQKSLDPEEWV